jgi:glucosamine--fructose-6-phosphate aminotransferase (isomerizing)
MTEAGQTAMAREIAEIPQLGERLLGRHEPLAQIAARIEQARPRIVVLCGRGSSGHVGVYLRYLFEARYGVLVSAAAPSVITTYLRLPDMRETLFIVISQSGRSPDIVMATEVARSLGALTLALVNDEASPAAHAAELVFPVGAGTEHAVAATKTVVLTMMAGAQLVATLTRDKDLGEALRRLPRRLAGALACDWSAWGDSLSTASAAFVAARGYGFGTAREIALKLTETLRLPALGYSTAELRHGPRAAITKRDTRPRPAAGRRDGRNGRRSRARPSPGRQHCLLGGRSCGHTAVVGRRSPGERSDRHAPAGLSRDRGGGASSRDWIPTTRRTSTR